ncbi:MAG TPA: NAD(P)/FAD-dependent oxidoreductase [Thermoplasmata archaeon]|nr:NAD(P)/FAD-dependent oxidoreductase [Thermoplasmata archaeon]
MRAYDVAIVGAGPAGGRAGMDLAKAGHSVLFLEKRDVVGVPVQCGEGLSKFGLDNAGLPEDEAWIRERVKGVRVVLPDGTDFTVSIPGFCIDRAGFDQWVVQRAVDAGAELRTRTKVTHMHRHDGGWVLETDRTEPVHAKAVIGADGPASNVARWAGLLQHRVYVKAIEYRFHESDWSYPCDGWLIFYYAQKYRGGYAWVFPKASYYDVGVLAMDRVKDLMDGFCAEMKVPMDRIHKKTGGDIPLRYTLTSLAAPGLAIVGDAAGVTNPVFGGGIHPALYSGRVAGEVAVEAFARGDMNHFIEYSRHMRASPFFDPVLWRTADLFSSWDDAHFNFAGDVVDHGDTRDVTTLRAFWRILTRHPKLLSETRDLLTMKRGLSLTQKYGW